MINFHLLIDVLHFLKSAWLLFGPHRTRKHLKDEQIKKVRVVKNQFNTLANGNNETFLYAIS